MELVMLGYASYARQYKGHYLTAIVTERCWTCCEQENRMPQWGMLGDSCWLVWLVEQRPHSCNPSLLFQTPVVLLLKHKQWELLSFHV